MLALAGRVAVAQRGEDADHHVVAGHHVEHRDAGPVRRPVGIAGEAHQARHRLHHQVVAGHVRALARAEAADRGVDERRGWRRATVVASSPYLAQAARLEVLDHDVGAAGQLARQREIVLVAQVQRDRPLAPVDAQVVGGDAVAVGRGPGAGLVAVGGLHLDHLGAHVGQQHRGVRACQHPREVGDEHTRQRACHVSSALRTGVRSDRDGLVRHGGQPREVGADLPRRGEQQRQVLARRAARPTSPPRAR